MKEKNTISENIAETKIAINLLKTKQEESSKLLREAEESIQDGEENVKEIEELVKENEEIRLKETQFKERCRQQLAELQEKIR